MHEIITNVQKEFIMFEQLQIINHRPEVFSVYTAEELWTDEYTAQQMLQYHLNEDVALASRTGEMIDKTVNWLQSRFDIGRDTRIADFGCGPGLYTSRGRLPCLLSA